MKLTEVLAPVLLIGIFPAVVTGIRQASCFPYKTGSHWVEPRNSICTCENGQKNCFNTISHCDGWGDVHYSSFDRNKFDFQGVCRYILARACYGSKRFSIEIEQVPWSLTTSVSGSFSIRFDQYTVYLSKPYSIEVYIGNTLVGTYPFFDDANLRCEMIGSYVFVSLKKLRVWFRWNFVYRFDVWIHKKWYKRKMCGLCGDSNGSKQNDLRLTPYDDTVSSVKEWGATWKALDRRQPERCRCASKDPTPPPRPPCSKYQGMMDKCGILMQGQVFADCNNKVDPAPFIDNCHLEMCECGRESRNDCLCVGVSGYVKACQEAGITVDMSWTSDHNCGVCRDPDSGFIYQNGQTWTYQCYNRTCTNGVLTSTDFPCCSHGDFFYPEGQIRVTTCNKYVCTNTEWEYKERICCFHHGVMYQLESTWKYNQCTVCECHPNVTVTCVSKPIPCPPGFKNTDSCCCLPRNWIGGKGSKGDTGGITDGQANQGGNKGGHDSHEQNSKGNTGGEGQGTTGSYKGGHDSHEQNSKGNTGGEGQGTTGSYKGGHSSKGKVNKGGNKGEQNSKGDTGGEGQGTTGGYKGGPAVKAK